jgi:hypothetical protein
VVKNNLLHIELNMSETNQTIHYIDSGNFYSVYGISTLIIVMLLLWYFIRSNISQDYYLEECHIHQSPKKRLEGLEGLEKLEGLEGFPIEDPAILAFMPEFKDNSPYDYQPIPILDENTPKPYKFITGKYGDVPLNIYDVKDIAYKPEWDHRTAIYIPNMRTIFRQTYTPVEASFWNTE